ASSGTSPSTQRWCWWRGGSWRRAYPVSVETALCWEPFKFSRPLTLFDLAREEVPSELDGNLRRRAGGIGRLITCKHDNRVGFRPIEHCRRVAEDRAVVADQPAEVCDAKAVADM